MGDWAQGEFAVAEQVAGEDYSCLPGLGVNRVLGLGGDAFYFPKNKDADMTAAQLELASLMISKEVQVSFNLKKGSLPIRGDIDLSSANDCMQKGLGLLADGQILPGADMALSRDTIGQIDDLMVQFWNDGSMSAEDVQKKYVDIIASAGLIATLISGGAGLVAGLVMTFSYILSTISLSVGLGGDMSGNARPNRLFRNLSSKIASIPMALTSSCDLHRLFCLDSGLFLYRISSVAENPLGWC